MLLEVKNIEKYYGNRRILTKALDDLSFEVDEGEFISIMGASGSGKTTLLNCISTIDTVSAGKILLENNDITELPESHLAIFRRDNLGFIFQNSNLLDTLTIEENIALPLTIKGLSPEEVDKRTQEISQHLQISDTLSKFPYEVSGGQKQRCAAARAVVTKPKLILADEPTGALDSQSAKIMMELLEHINESLGATILLVTHDALSASYADRILFLKDGKIFNEIRKGEKSNRVFYHEILDVLSFVGGN
ncbi:lantibiotic ABC transporter ATP-binding protein [[Clostridium] sordellii]|uniref:ABC-type transport system, ATP-binding protein Tn916-like, CTn1-Orf9 n=1 Tax=Paraclostridium sordellii TaxID=1505 RepID=A0ABM9RNK2_PARSO|nr:ABC transporter ATP-binding protein [Paeniclostridium sordellii]CEJ73614.1 ABC-type transport system, ATP-binding protein Tn916-like, CTn1-Orf9 [[Clostridium] sordellii] [Paeniclostridium sordellii]CEN69162.1 lantibiotic ABC transporter ATP-binding protein [[Clostridium] sordellii] [Paeniclostridium sordellii]CEN72430.1 lantibiotic ABC transporter ATP-binding protein [[Clostridium] sordellii] [Paeniclostridium sordellii]CEO23860.1 lantibiotic ABC transporter ATP-binding protein [[Clostridium